jgi:predicted RNA-binding Zn ribbon-like protein
MADLQALRFDGGSLSLNLLATVGRRFGEPIERLTSVGRLRQWLAGVGLDHASASNDEDLAQIRRLREALHPLYRATLAREHASARALDEVNAILAGGVPQFVATRTGLRLSAPTIEPVLALIAADAVRILAGSARDDLRACAAPDCRMLYLAPGRRRRRWCSSDHCGNRSRVAAHRARAAGGSR